MIVSACMFIFGYAMTWAPGVWILIGETFPTRTRAKQGALSTASNWFDVCRYYSNLFEADSMISKAFQFPSRILHAVYRLCDPIPIWLCIRGSAFSWSY